MLDTFGTSSELMAAGEIFPYAFQVFRNCILLATFKTVEGIKKLIFSGDIMGGHFDVLIPNLTQPISPSLQLNPVSSDPMDCDPQMLSSSVTQLEHTPFVERTSDESIIATLASVIGRIGQIRRKRFTNY